MHERGITFLLALAALVAFYGLWLRPAPSLDPDADTARPTSAERRGDGYAGLAEWLQRSRVGVRSWRERYTALADLDIPPRGNLLILTLPGMEVFRTDEFGALDKWVRRGNTLLINAALLDQPGWAVGRESGTVVEVESLTALEFETSGGREARLDPTPLAQRVRETDERDRKQDEDQEDEDEIEEVTPFTEEWSPPEKIVLTVTAPHALLEGVRTLAMETDYKPAEWSLRMPYDNFVLTLARAADGEGAFFEQRVGAGRILLSASGSLFTNRALGNDDNALLMSNIVSTCVASDGVVLFDDLRQGLAASYDPVRFYRDPRLYKTIFIALALWLAWVLGGTRLRAPAIERHDPSEAALVRHAGGLIARTVAPWQQALRLYDHFFDGVARAARGVNALRGAERGELWQWLERHAAILPQELDQLKTWYADAHAMRKLPLVSLQNLLDNLERRLKT
jgi:Domain of unknown function (DUF4350)